MSTCTSGEDLLREGNVEFLDKNYKSAIKLYSESIELDDTLIDTFLKRAKCYAKVKNYQAALGDANKAISLDPMSAKAYNIKGEISFILGDYQTAQESFEKCSNLDRKDSIYSVWVDRCKTASKGPKPTPPKSTHTPAPSAAKPTTTTSSSSPKPTTTTSSNSNSNSNSNSSSSSSSSQPAAASAPKPPQPQKEPQPPRPPAPKAPKAPRAPKAGSQPSTPKPEPTPEPEPEPAQPAVPAPAPTPQRYTWYQTDNFVTVTVFVKAAKPTDVKIDFEERALSVSIDLSADNQFLLDLDLAHEISPSESKYEVMSTKIEIKMKKTTPVKWATIERKEEEVPQAKKPKEKNWDKILANEEEDKDTSFNQLMRDMYSCATEDERRAMMKSFHESGGTVLSADWKDVGKGNVEPKPPVGVTKWEKDV